MALLQSLLQKLTRSKFFFSYLYKKNFNSINFRRKKRLWQSYFWTLSLICFSFAFLGDDLLHSFTFRCIFFYFEYLICKVFVTQLCLMICSFDECFLTKYFRTSCQLFTFLFLLMVVKMKYLHIRTCTK